ncbi:MAG: VTT domain-containing protein [Spirochaetaceae bacterium]|nr:VTT domain-containing protein [Spirochaetaceae bacterium]
MKHSYVGEDGRLDFKGLLASTLFWVPLTILLIWLEVVAVRHSGIQDNPRVDAFLGKYGLLGIGIFVWFVDMLIVPLTVDVVWPFVLGYPAWQAVLILAIPSACGGYCGYWIGRLLQHIPLVGRIAGKLSHSKWGPLMVRYGAFGVFLGALTPIPFTTVSWTAGMLHVDPKSTLAACFIGRLLRMVVYLVFVYLVA